MKHEDLIEEQYRDSDGYWIYLKRGWRIPGDAHGIVEDTKREALSKLRNVVPCDCDDCRRG